MKSQSDHRDDDSHYLLVELHEGMHPLILYPLLYCVRVLEWLSDRSADP